MEEKEGIVYQVIKYLLELKKRKKFSQFEKGNHIPQIEKTIFPKGY